MSAKNIAIRVDASNEIGTGHFMRCLTLADGLQQRGAKVCFVSRYLPRHLAEALKKNGHRLIKLADVRGEEPGSDLAHAHWLGTSQEQDAEECIGLLGGQSWDWLLVDHYALDMRWESALRRVVGKILVIDDLADRRHDAELLLDQNLYPNMAQRYADLLSNGCRALLGPSYALLRPEFVEARARITSRNSEVRKIFVFFGGSDKTNETGKSLAAIAALNRQEILVDVVVGAGNAHHKSIEALCTSISGIQLHCQVDNMAQLMSQADLALGAGGSTTWERCALGLPSLVISVADNQVAIADGVDKAGAHRHLGLSRNVSVAQLTAAIEVFSGEPGILEKMSRSAYALVDARGCERVIKTLKEFT
jgi:UDP-2,4-diacetamido-2,4,6-trideoxy-beta-L-altropyranose hydrolase